jgi:ABC-type spermidine/putrescine transport system permease subunit I
VAALQGGLTPRQAVRIMLLPSRRQARRLVVLGLPLLAIAGLILGPLLITLAVSFFEKQGFGVRPAFTLASYRLFFTGVRLEVLERSFWVALSSTAIMLLIAYPIAYIVTLRVRPELTRAFLFLFAVPFLVNYIVRTFAWADILSRTGPANSLLLETGLVEQPLDWLLYSDFAVYLGLITAYMPFMIFPIWLSLSGIDRRLLEASWVSGEPPLATFRRVTLPLSLPGVFAAAIFGFVGSFGEVAVSLILGGTGYQLLGNAIASALDVLNYPLAAAISTVATGAMLVLLLLWYRLFDVRLFLGKLTGRA